MPSQGPQSGQKCYVTPAFSGVPKNEEQNQNWLPQLCLLEEPKSGPMWYVTPAFLGVPNKWEQNQNWMTQPCLLKGGKVGRSATSPLHSPGSTTMGNKIRIGCLRYAFSGAQKGSKCYVIPAFSGVPNNGEQNQNWLPQVCLLGGPKKVEVLRHHCILGGPQQWGAKSELAASAMPSQGPKSGRKCYFRPAFRGVPPLAWDSRQCILGQAPPATGP